MHRPDYLCDPEEVATVFSRLQQAGKVREFGVSNFRPSQVAALQKACPMPLVVNQVEISLARLDCLHDGTLDQCLAEKMTPMAWSPLGAGRLVSKFLFGVEPGDPATLGGAVLALALVAVAAAAAPARRAAGLDPTSALREE